MARTVSFAAQCKCPTDDVRQARVALGSAGGKVFRAAAQAEHAASAVVPLRTHVTRLVCDTPRAEPFAKAHSARSSTSGSHFRLQTPPRWSTQSGPAGSAAAAAAATTAWHRGMPVRGQGTCETHSGARTDTRRSRQLLSSPPRKLLRGKAVQHVLWPGPVPTRCLRVAADGHRAGGGASCRRMTRDALGCSAPAAGAAQARARAPPVARWSWATRRRWSCTPTPAHDVREGGSGCVCACIAPMPSPAPDGCQPDVRSGGGFGAASAWHVSAQSCVAAADTRVACSVGRRLLWPGLVPHLPRR